MEEAPLHDRDAPRVLQAWPHRLLAHLLAHPALVAAVLIAMFGAASLVDIVFSDNNLNPDEAYYWDWSRRLDFGYYTKPPLIAYINAIATVVFGHHEWALRGAGLALVMGALAVAYRLGKELGRGMRGTPALTGGGVTGLCAVCALLALPEWWGSATVADTNKAFFLCWLLAILAYLKATSGERRWWYVLGLAMGFGLLAKYTMLLLLAALAVHLLLYERAWLRTRYPWLATGMAALLNTGVIWWNCTQQWAVVQHYGNLKSPPPQYGHQVVDFFIQQASIASPLFFPLMAYAVVLMAIALRRDKRAGLLFLTSAPMFAFTLAVAFDRPVYPHWAFPAYLAAAPAVAWVVTTFSAVHVPARRAMAWCFTAAFLPMFLIAMVRVPGERIEGRALAGRVAPHITADNAPFVFSPYRDICASLAFYLPGQPRVYGINLGFRERNQYDIWDGWDGLTGRDGLFVCFGDAAQTRGYADTMVAQGLFESMQLLETSQFFIEGTPVTFTVVRMRDFKGGGKQNSFLNHADM